MTDTTALSHDLELPQPLLAELRALREQVQSQHGLISALTGRLGNRPRPAATHIREIADPLPAHAARAADREVDRSLTREEPAPAVRSAPVGAAWWPMTASAPAALHPVPGWALYGHHGPLKAVGFSVIGLDAAAVRSTVEFVARAQRSQRNFVPVFLTDLDDLQVFRDHGFVAERLSAARGDSTAAKQRQLAARRDLIQRKWNLGTILDMSRATRPDLSLVGSDRGAAAEPQPVAAPPSLVASSPRDHTPRQAQSTKGAR